MGGSSLEVPTAEKAPEERLDSWKEIATYLGRDVTTVQRWEKREGMPVHRHLHEKRGSVYALTSELDAWRKTRKAAEGARDEDDEGGGEASEGAGEKRSGRLRWWLVVAGATVAGLVLVTYFGFLRHRGNAVQWRIRSIAVLPMRNLSGDASQDYLAEGMTEALIDRLSAIRELRVTSHTSVMRFKNPQQSVPEIAKMLGVDAIVEGSVIRDGNRIRVTAQLIRGATDEHFWSQTYDREMSDVLALESGVAQSIASKVQVTVTGKEQQRLVADRPVAPEVYESYLQGRFALRESNDQAGTERAIGYFEDAVRRDGAFAPAYVGLAAAYSDLGTIFAGAPPRDNRAKARDAALRALALDPDLTEAHVLLADVYKQQYDWADAEAEFKRALDLSPNNAEAYVGYADWLKCEGRLDEALSWAEHGRELDPLAVDGDEIAWTLFLSRKYDAAIRELHTELALEPQDSTALWYLGFTLIANNQPKDAIPVLERAAEISNRSPGVLGVLIRAYAQAGRRADAMKLLAELKRRRSRGYVPAGAFVNAYLGLGDKEETFVWLDKAYEERSNILQFVKTHPYFDPIRSDPRFVDLVRRIGLG